ncbi:MAG: T9SS C-terminal target domain-containing protein [Balneolaceae bacterium]|nr:MAG: T9SS C-terminal target domain-containing protein [Balneolaceae bacterium]
MVYSTKQKLLFPFFLFIYLLITDPSIAQDMNELFRATDITPQGWAAKDRSHIAADGLEINSDVLYELRENQIRDFSIINSTGTVYTVDVQRVIHHDENNWSVTGHIDGNWHNSVTLSYANGRVLSTIRNVSNHSFYRVQFDNTIQNHVMLHIDPHETDEISCGVDHELSSENIPVKESQKIPSFSADPDRLDVIDVMIVYTPLAEDWANLNAGGIDNVINESMAVAQQSADNGQTNVIFRLVHRALVDYREDQGVGDNRGSVRDLRRLTASPNFNPFGSDYAGYLEEVHEWRDEYGADLVAMFTFVDDVGGIAWLMNNPNGRPELGFSITRVQQAMGTTHAHEMGHNMGNNHSRNQQENAAGNAGGIFEYSTGWRWTGNDGRGYVSVMTYNEGDLSFNTFSNPDVTHLGAPTGSYTAGGAPADNARSMREIKHIIADYRDGDPLFFVPTLIINDVRDVTLNSAVIEAEITDDGGEDVITNGICWSQNINPTLSDNCIELNSTSNQFSATISGLEQSTTYYVRAYARNRTGTGYSPNRNFFTLGTDTPEIATNEPQEVGYFDAVIGGTITDDGGTELLETGVCYSKLEMPGFADNCLATDSPQTDFTVTLTGLEHSTNYFVRAYATNQNGSSFGNDVLVATDILLPPVALDATNRTAVSFRANWEAVEDANNYRIDVSQSEDFEDYISGYQNRNVGGGTGFTVTGLAPGTTYYYRLRTQLENGLSLDSDEVEVTTVNVSASASQVEFSRERVLATGIQESEVRVQVLNNRLQPVAGVDVSLRASGGNPTIVAIQEETDENGRAIFSITHTREENVTFTAIAAGLELSRLFTIEFVFADGELTLGDNFPNPFRIDTTIPIVIPEPTRVRIDLFNSNGAHIRSITDQEFNTGYFEIPLNMSGLSSGVYFYRMVTDSDVKTEKLMVIQ